MHPDGTTPDHVGNHGVLGERRSSFRGHLFTVAEHCNGIRNLQHIIKKVRDENNAASLSLDFAQHVEQSLDLRWRQRRRRLIKYDDACAGEQYARQFNKLLQAHRQRTHPRFGIYIKTKTCDQPRCLTVDAGPVDGAHFGDWLMAEKHIFSDSQIGNG